jgi:hypothetical protein
MASKNKFVPSRSRAKSFREQAEREIDEPRYRWIKEIGLTARDLAGWLAEDAEIDAALGHVELRKRSGRSRLQAMCAMDATRATVRRIERTSTKHLTLDELCRYLMSVGAQLEVYAKLDGGRFRVRI